MALRFAQRLAREMLLGDVALVHDGQALADGDESQLDPPRAAARIPDVALVPPNLGALDARLETLGDLGAGREHRPGRRAGGLERAGALDRGPIVGKQMQAVLGTLPDEQRLRQLIEKRPEHGVGRLRGDDLATRPAHGTSPPRDRSAGVRLVPRASKNDTQPPMLTADRLASTSSAR